METASAEAPKPYDRFSLEVRERIAANEGVLAIVVLEACNMARIEARFGREHRDRLLALLAERIREALREVDFVAQTGEQTFGVVLSGLRNAGHATLAAKKLLRLSEKDAQQAIKDLEAIDLRLGMALCPGDGDDLASLLRSAQLALEVAKDSQQGLVAYEQQSIDSSTVVWDLHDELAAAIRDGDLDVYYQPKIDIQTGAINGAEALARWFSAKRGPVSPDEFVPVAEASKLIEPMTRFVLNSAMRNLMMWQRDGHDIGVAVNLPSSMLLDPGIVVMVDSLMSIWDTGDQRLTLELTESAIVADVETCFATMTRLRELGCRIAIDDFGTGFSSFSHFKSIPADELKIDRAFVAGMREDTADQRIVEAIINIAHAFDMKVVAEGIEDRETLRMLRRLGCDAGQGYLVAEAMSQEDYDAWLDARRYAQPEP